MGSLYNSEWMSPPELYTPRGCTVSKDRVTSTEKNDMIKSTDKHSKDHEETGITMGETDRDEKTMMQAEQPEIYLEAGGSVENLDALTVELPEDIARLKAVGHLKLAKRVIEKRLERELPKLLRERLLLEREILARLPQQYPYSWQGALDKLKETFADFENEELDDLLAEGAFEWICIEGEIKLKDNFVENLIKTRKDLAFRLLNEETLWDRRAQLNMLDDVMHQMKEKGSLRSRIHVRSRASVRPSARREGVRIQVQLPLPIEYAQVKKFQYLGCSPECGKSAPAEAFQRTICFETDYQSGQTFEVEYELENEMQYWDWKEAAEKLDLGGADREPETDQNKDAKAYLGEQLPHIRFTPYLRALAQEIVGEETNPVRKAKKIYDYITTHVMYSYVRSYFTIEQQATFTATNLKGDCGLQALLFITLCRIAGVPARWQSGLYACPKNIGCHDWAQFYIESYGWLYADASFGGAAWRAGDLERWEFYFGNLDPYRIPAASEYQKNFYFPKKYLRQDPYDNQMGEAEYEDQGLLEGSDFDTKHEIIEICLL